MKYDLQKLNSLLSTLELDIEKTTESEKELRKFFKLKESSTNYYLENIDVVNTLLKCCVKSTTRSLKIDKSIDKVYELLRNDLYKYKSKDIKDNNIEFDQIDELEFFNFLNKLYRDPDFVEKTSQKDSTLLLQVKETQEKLEHILKHQIKKHFKNVKLDDRQVKNFNFQSKQELYDEAYNRLMHLDISSCLKNIYYKDSVFTIADDIKLLFQCVNTEVVQEQTSKFKKYIKNHFNLDVDVQKDKELLLTLGAIFAASSVTSMFSSSVFNSTNLLEFSKALGMSISSAFVASSAVAIFPIAAHQKFLKQKSNALNEQDVVNQKYKQLEDEAFYSVALAIRYNSDAFEELKSLTDVLTNVDEYDRSQIEDLFNNCQYIQKAFEKLKKRVDQLQVEKKEDIKVDSAVSVPYHLTHENRTKYKEFCYHFKNFTQTDKDRLLRLISTSKEKTKQIEELIKSSKLFSRDLSTIQTFDELMKRLQENSTKRQSTAQKYLENLLEEAGRNCTFNQNIHVSIR